MQYFMLTRNIRAPRAHGAGRSGRDMRSRLLVLQVDATVGSRTRDMIFTRHERVVFAFHANTK